MTTEERKKQYFDFFENINKAIDEFQEKHGVFVTFSLTRYGSEGKGGRPFWFNFYLRINKKEGRYYWSREISKTPNFEWCYNLLEKLHEGGEENEISKAEKEENKQGQE